MENAVNVVPHVNTTIDENDINRGAQKVLKVIRPEWKEENITFKLLTDGITNKLVACLPIDLPDSETVLVRVYGNKTDLLIDRKAETRNILLLNKAGLAPNLYATFNNGLAYRFVPGSMLNGQDPTNPNIYKLVATKMAQLHRVNVPGEESPKPFIWKKIETFLNLVPDVFSDPNKHKRVQELVPSKSKIAEEIKYLRNILENLRSPVVFCHNDLLLGNVIYTESENSVTFIDFEYGALNYQAFDIGNHFNEFVGLDNIDYSKYPNKDIQLDWLKIYLSEFNGRSPTEIEVEQLYVVVNKFALLSHIIWAIWALIQAEHSYIDFDFVEYSATRLNEYFARKAEFLSLDFPR